MTNLVITEQPKKKYIIGTRGSLLALTQCGQVKDELERLTGDQFELKVIKTQGDMITDKPLWQLDGKDFFTKELDAELLQGTIDLVVHSYKDLGSDRPEGIELAAITKRKFAHDILLIKKTTIEKLSEKKELIVGTSSPRRIVNIEKNLSKYIPFGDQIKVSTKMLRGNVNTRIGKLQDDQYDAIVLALPGIERLALTKSSKEELTPLLSGLDFMILPHSIFPAAASQGALGIECLENRSDEGELQQKLKMMEDKNTVAEISRERQAFASYGGGCHLAVGINVSKISDYYVHTHSGVADDKEVLERHLEGSFANTEKKTKAFIGLPSEKYDNENYVPCKLLKKESIKNVEIPKNELLLSSTYGIDNIDENKHGIYTSGTRTWRKLAQKNVWVNASCDSLGEDHLENIRSSILFDIFFGTNRKLSVLTHSNSQSDIGEILPIYKKTEEETTSQYDARLTSCDIMYWTSYTQYQTYLNKYPSIKDSFHCCGLGKTLKSFKDAGITIRPFASMEDFRLWFEK